MQLKPESYDLTIVGGGLVGSSLACALEPFGLRIALIEAAESAQAASGFDQRKLALSKLSLDALMQLGVLQRLKHQPTAISQIHVSRVGDFGRVLLKASDFAHSSFGGVVLAQDLGAALVGQVAALQNTQRYCPANVTDFSMSDDGAELHIETATDGKRLIRARFMVAADGTNSFVRQELGIGTQVHDYQQQLFVCSLQAEKASNGMAYERFSEQGPVALLPMNEGQFGSICSVSAEQASEIASLSDSAYGEYFQQRFGWRVGKILQVGKRSHYPLKRVLAERIAVPGCVLMGNAAQTIHPIGAQGFNLGLRDVLSFTQLVKQFGLNGELSARYAQSRMQDREHTLAFSDGLAKLTSNQGFPLHALRSVALSSIGQMPHLAAAMVSSAMGMRHQQLLDDNL